MRALFLALALAAACLLAPGVASAGELSIHRDFDTTIEYIAKPRENNKVDAHSAFADHVVDVYDAGAKITTVKRDLYIPGLDVPGKTWPEQWFPCQLVDDYHGRCITPDPREPISCDLTCEPHTETPQRATFAPDRLIVDLGDGTNSFHPSPLTADYNVTVYGGPGDDTIWIGHGYANRVEAGDGYNTIISERPTGEVPNFLFGGSGDDTFNTANNGLDVIFCGDGGYDVVIADPGDELHGECEYVKLVDPSEARS